MPWVGLGGFKVQDGGEVASSVKAALEAGYRSIDTAPIYGNEDGVGKAITESNVPQKNYLLLQRFGMPIMVMKQR